MEKINEEIKERMASIINSGNYTDSSNEGGFYVRRFEEELHKYLGKPTFVLNSGTSALITALKLSGVGHGDEVIVPAFTFRATWNAVHAVGATAVPVDIKYDDFTIDPELISSKISNLTKAIIPVHLYGNVADIKRIKDHVMISNNRKIYIIEDSAQAFGSNDGQRRCGTIGDFGCFSFYPSKIINTMEGGAISCGEDHIPHVKNFRNHANNELYWGRIDWGLNLRMTEMSAMMGEVQMKYVDEIIKNRKVKEMEVYERIKDDTKSECTRPRFNTNGQLYTVKAFNREEFLGFHPTARVYYDYYFGDVHDCPNAVKASKTVASFPTA